MIAVDASVVIAAFATWHEFHEPARRVVDARPRLVAHSALEAYSVLTRLPPPHRIAPGPAREFLAQRFGQPPLTLDAGRYASLITRMARSDIIGGAVYDALIGTVAADARATLATCDRRAIRTYEIVGAAVQLVGLNDR